MPISARDRQVLRDLAKRVAEIAAMPIQAERRELWKRHNRLERVRPMVLVFPEGSWRELLPTSVCVCEDAGARGMEWNLRHRIFYHERIPSDNVIEKEWIVSKAVHVSDWGLVAQHKPSTTATGSWAFDPVINVPSDLKKLKFPEVRYDEETTQQSLAAAQDLFGDILDVKLKGVIRISFHLMNYYTGWRGLEQVFWDMTENPNMLRDAMSFLEEGFRNVVRQYVDMNLLSLNNDSSYHNSGGVGYTDELPQPDCDPNRVRPIDMWASAEAQELDIVSPEMHEEFSMQYERRLLEPFGLTGYGCCDDLTPKLDDVLRIPRMRRISIAPFADVEKSAEKLGGKAIFSWKPKPAFLVGEFNDERVRADIRHTLDAARDCVVEMILKDTHTCEHHPERFTRWTEIAQECARAV